MLSRPERLLTFLVIAVMIAAVLSPGCSSDEDSCTAVLDEVASQEKSADSRMKTMDFDSWDDIFISQITASKNQYKDALDALYALGPSPCLSGYAYETRVKSLQLKIDFLDVVVSLSENDKKAEQIFQTTTPGFRKGLVEVMDEYANLRERIQFLTVMSGDIDRSLLDPQFETMPSFVRDKLAIMLESVDARITFLAEYR